MGVINSDHVKDRKVSRKRRLKTLHGLYRDPKIAIQNLVLESKFCQYNRLNVH